MNSMVQTGSVVVSEAHRADCDLWIKDNPPLLNSIINTIFFFFFQKPALSSVSSAFSLCISSVNKERDKKYIQGIKKQKKQTSILYSP